MLGMQNNGGHLLCNRKITEILNKNITKIIATFIANFATGKDSAHGHAAVRHRVHGLHDFLQHGRGVEGLPSRSCYF